VYALYQGVRYVVLNNTPGDFVECVVMRGGSVIAIAQTLKLLGAERYIYLYGRNLNKVLKLRGKF
jgi:O-methyltransferase